MSSRMSDLGASASVTCAGAITTLGRGGSDLTATLIGAALGVQEVQVWKDVDGESLALNICCSVYTCLLVWEIQTA